MFKKISAFALVLLLVFSIAPIQSFAVLGFDKIEKVDAKSFEEFSLKDIENYVEYYEGKQMTEEDKQYILESELDVTISTGEVIKIKKYNGQSENGKRVVDSYSWVNVDECLAAAEAGKNTVTVYTEVILYSSILVELDKKTVENEISFVDCFVKKLTLTEGDVRAHKISYGEGTDDCYYSILSPEGLVFDIEYGDGTAKRAAIEKADQSSFSTYTLDGKSVDVYIDDETDDLKAFVSFMDEEIEVPVTIVPYPVKEIIVDEVTFDDKFNEKTLTFTVVRPDDTKEVINYEFGKYIDVSLSGYESIRMYDSIEFDGVRLYIIVYPTKSDEYPATLYKAAVVMADAEVYGYSELYEGPKEEETFLGRIIYKIRQFFIRIFETLFA